MGLSRNHFQLNSGRSPVRSQLRPFSSRRFNSPVYYLDWPVPVATVNRLRCGRSLVRCGLTSAWRCPCQAFWVLRSSARHQRRTRSMGKISGFDVVDGSVRIYVRSMVGEPGTGLSGATTRTRYWSPSSAWHRDGWWACGVGGAGRDLRHVGCGLVQTGQPAGISGSGLLLVGWRAATLSRSCHKRRETWWDAGRYVETISAGRREGRDELGRVTMVSR
jgi:hypothetical protein